MRDFCGAVGSKRGDGLARPTSHIYLAAGIVLVSAGLRLFRLMDQSIWYDEAFDVLFAQGPLSTILDGAVNDTLPPLHYILLHMWMRVGSCEFVVKLFPVFMGILATATVFPIGSRLLGPKAGLGGMLLTALSPFQVYYAREVRMYSQLLFFGLMSVLFLVRCTNGRKEKASDHRCPRRGDWIGLVVFTALAVYTHTFGFLVPLSIGSVALALNWHSGRFVRRVLLSGLAVTLLASPWMLLVLPAQAGRVVKSFWVSRPSVLAPFTTLHMFLAGYAIPPSWMPAALFVTLSLGMIAMYRAIRASERSFVLLLSWLFGPILFVWILSLFAPMYLDRLFIASAPALYLLLAWSLGRVPRGLSCLLGVLLVGLVLLSLGHYYFDPKYHKPPMRAAATHIADWVLPGDVVLHTSDSSFLTFAFYGPELEQFLIGGDPDHQPGGARTQSLELLGFATVRPDRVLSRHGRVWLVVALDHSIEFQRQVAQKITETRTLAYEANIGGISVYLLTK